MPSGQPLRDLLFAQSTLPAVELDTRTGAIRRANTAFAALSGYPAAELRHRVFLELVPRDERPAVQAHLHDPSAPPLTHGLLTRAGARRPVRTGVAQPSGAHAQAEPRLLLVEALPLETPASPSPPAEALPPEPGNIFRHIVLNAHEGIWTLDAQLRTTFANPRMCEMLGYTAAELHGRPLLEFLFPEDVPAQVEELERRRHGLSSRYERRFRRRDGTELWTLVAGTPLPGRDRPFGGTFGMFTDITERRGADRALQLSEERYRCLLAAATDYVFTVHFTDGQPSSTTHGPGCVKISGYLEYEYAADPYLWYRMIAPEDRPLVERHIARATTGDQADTIEHRLLHRDGSIRWVRNTLVPRRDPTGRLLCLDGLVTDITERTLALQQLREREALYRAVIETSADGFWIIDLQGRLLEVNDAYVRRSGYRREELLALHVGDLEAQESPTDISARLVRIQQKGGDLFETRHRTKDGTIWLAEINVSHWPIGDGRLFVFIRDVQRRKRSESLLRTRLHLAELSEHGPIAPLVEAALDAARLHTGSNIGFFDFVGSEQEALARPTGMPLPFPSDHSAVGARQAPVSWTGARADCRLTRTPLIQNTCASLPEAQAFPPGRAPLVRALTVPVLRRDRVAAIIGVGNKTTDYTTDDVEAVQELASLAMDFVERVLAEQALRHREHQLRLIIDTVPALIAHVDPAYRCRLINQTFAHWFDEPLATVLGRLLPEQVGPVAWQEIQPFVDRALAGEALVHEHELQLRTAGRRWLSICYSPDRDAAGTVRGIVILANDITDRKQLESQLLRAQRLEVVGRLAGGVAHDLNNILQPVLMAPELLRPSIRDSDTLQLVDTIETSVRRGAEIIRQLLAFSRGTEACRVPLLLGTVVKEVALMLGGTFPKDITLHCELPARPGTVLGDSTQLHQVLMNLCVNARDAMRATGGTLTLRVEAVTLRQPVPDSIPQSRPGRYQVLTVADTGTGILPENLPRLFDPFFTTKDVGEGTGLGLPTVLGIVRSHDGFLHVASSPGHGSAFRVFLPESDETAPVAAPLAMLPPCAGNGRLVLVVDDEAPVRELIRHTLLRHDFQVREAANGAEALVLLTLETSAIAVVVVDLLMPVLDGSGFIRELRTRRPDLPIIAISGHLGPQRLDPAVLQAIQTLLPKPFDSAQLLAALARLPAPVRPDRPMAGAPD